jgi:hypothetical protein
MVKKLDATVLSLLKDTPGFHHQVSLDIFYNSVNLWENLPNKNM